RPRESSRCRRRSRDRIHAWRTLSRVRSQFRVTLQSQPPKVLWQSSPCFSPFRKDRGQEANAEPNERTRPSMPKLRLGAHTEQDPVAIAPIEKSDKADERHVEPWCNRPGDSSRRMELVGLWGNVLCDTDLTDERPRAVAIEIDVHVQSGEE